MTDSKPRIAISACLIGQAVRYNGGHKRDTYITGPLSAYFDYQPLCPESEIGMGIPRPPIRLVGDIQRPRAVGVEDASMDVTDSLAAFAVAKADSLAQVDGAVLKKDSPSCGMERVKVYPQQRQGPGVRKGQGVFARILMEKRPNLPVEEEGRLHDPVLRENFINRVYAYRRWRLLRTEGLTPKGLLAFHADHKYLLMAHSQAAYQRLGRSLSDLSAIDIETLADDYITEFMQTLRRRVNRKRHCNVLQHIMGYLKRSIDADDKAELLDRIEAYRRGEVPLVVPITLLRHYFRRHPDPYMARQIYLQPHPDELGLRNSL